jgi:RNA exonuclease 1
LVGHSLENDLRAMHIAHHQVIDTSVLFQRKNGTKFKLKSLAEKILKRKIQNGEHDSA